jgi:septum formation protein
MSKPARPAASPLLILASSSPRRIALLREHGYTFNVIPPHIDEPSRELPHTAPAEQAEALSFFKASAVADSLDCGLILAADTLVTYQGQIFGKPVDTDDARRILLTLGGTSHQVMTGVTLLDAATGRRDIRHDVSNVKMIRLSDDELDRYLASRAWIGKAGAYGVQDRADAYIERIDGSYTNVVGLPMELVARMLAEWSSQRATGDQ